MQASVLSAADVHRATAADSLAAGAAERERGIDLVLDLDQRVENHRAAGVHVHFIGVHARVRARIRIEAVDDELADVFRAGRRRVRLAGGLVDLRIRGKRELNH